MSIKTDVSLGEFIDKMVILEIKESKITNAEKLQNVRKELESLRRVWDASGYNMGSIESEIIQLKNINETLWDIEDKIREKESLKVFDDEFIELARHVYISNDKRSKIKLKINEMLGSEFNEVKSYANYDNEPENK